MVSDLVMSWFDVYIDDRKDNIRTYNNIVMSIIPSEVSHPAKSLFRKSLSFSEDCNSVSHIKKIGKRNGYHQKHFGTVYSLVLVYSLVTTAPTRLDSKVWP